MSGISNSTALAAECIGEENGVEARAGKKTPRVLFSRTTMNQNSRNALRSLVEQEMLAEFWTTFAWDVHSNWNRLLPRRWQTQLARRSISEAPAGRVKCSPFREMVRLGLRGTPLERLLCSGERPFSVMRMGIEFDQQVSQRLSVLRPDLVYANEGAALRTFREAHRLGIPAVHEQSSSYWRWTHDLFAEEAERAPEFTALLPNLGDSARHLEQKEEELRLADYVFAPSEHVFRTLAGVVADEKIRVISYGAPPVRSRAAVNLDSGAPLQVLFVGNLGQHKGIGYLLKAIDMLGSGVELTMVGRRLRPNAKVDEACNRWNWHKSLPHSGVLEVMERSDVLVLPSLSEAFGLVVTEALASGLPVIVTPNAGASEMICDGREGFVVPIRSAEAIAEKLEILRRDREMLAEMARRAQITAEKNSWDHYRNRWARTLRNLA